MNRINRIADFKLKNPVFYFFIVTLPAIIVFLSTLLIQFEATTGTTNKILLSLILSIIVEFIVIKAEKIYMEIETSTQFKHIEDIALKNQVFITLKGSEEIISHISRNIENAEMVRNTFVEQSRIFMERKGLVKSIVLLYQRWVDSNNSCHWEDIIGRREFFSHRYADIKAPKNRDDEPVISAHVLYSSMPIANFMILTFKDKSKSIYIGWSQAKIPSSDTVIYTKSPPVISMYEDLFDSMKKSRNCWNGGSKKDGEGYRLILADKDSNIKSEFEENIIAEKEGVWATVGYDTSKEGPTDCALVHIKYHDGIAKANVKIFTDENGIIKCKRRIHNKEFGHHMNRLVFEFDDSKTNDAFIMHFRKQPGKGTDKTITKGFISRKSSPHRLEFDGVRASRLNVSVEGHNIDLENLFDKGEWITLNDDLRRIIFNSMIDQVPKIMNEEVY